MNSQYLNIDTQTDDSILKMNKLDFQNNRSIYSNGHFVDADRVNELAERYDLEKPSIDILGFEQYILFEKSDIQPFNGNVWFVHYLTTSIGFTVSVANVGKDPLDKVSGKISKYDMKGKEISKTLGSHSFDKLNVNTGIVSTWQSSKTAVSDYFEYEVTVTEDGTTYKYNNFNETKHSQQRYNFTAGLFNSIQALGGERHHFVSKDSLEKANFSTNFPSIRMMQPDHVKTPSWGSGMSNTLFRGLELALLNDKKYRELLKMEVDGLKAVPDTEGNYFNLQIKYYDEILVAIDLSEIFFGIVGK